MLTLALAALLAAEEPSPPPLVPADPEPEQPPQLAVQPRAERAPEDPDTGTVADVPDDAIGFSGTRVGVVAAAAGGSGALLVGGALWFAFNNHDGSGVMLAILSLPVSLFVGTGVGFVVHRSMGGVGGYGGHLGGGAIGGAVSLLATLAVLSLSHGNPDTLTVAGGVIGAGVLFGVGTALMGELSNYRTLKEQGVALALLPTRGGAIASAGFRF